MSTAIRTSPAQRLRPLDRFDVAGAECTVQFVKTYDNHEAVDIHFTIDNDPMPRSLVAWKNDPFVIKYNPM